MTKLTRKADPLAHLSPQITAALEEHAKNLARYHAGEVKGAAEQFGYGYLFGREMLLAKERLPHGNSGNRDLGFQQWLTHRFPKWSYRTCANRMEFARCFNESKDAQAVFKKRPLLLTKGKLTVKDRATILEAVPMVLDSKSMTRFMRDSRLLRDPEKAQHHPRKPLDPEKALAAKTKQAERLCETYLSDSKLLLPLLKHLERPLHQKLLGANIDFNKHLSTFLKGPARSAASTQSAQPSL